MSDNYDMVKRQNLRILSLDGDGPGCLSQLLMIGEYMNRLAYDLKVDVDSLLPADYFDVIGGTGFGGWIALLLGRLRLPVSKAIEYFVAVGRAVFPPDEKVKISPQERARRLKAAVEDTLRALGVQLDASLREKETLKRGCNVIVLAAPAAYIDHCTLFRTYPRRSSEYTLVEAACSIMSTLDYFSPIPIGQEEMYGFNNPTYEILTEVQRHYKEDARISLILSLGSGKGIYEQDKLLSRVAMDYEKAAKTLANELKARLRDWDRCSLIRSHTEAYLGKTIVMEAVGTSLKALTVGTGGVTDSRSPKQSSTQKANWLRSSRLNNLIVEHFATKDEVTSGTSPTKETVNPFKVTAHQVDNSTTTPEGTVKNSFKPIHPFEDKIQTSTQTSAAINSTTLIQLTSSLEDTPTLTSTTDTAIPDNHSSNHADILACPLLDGVQMGRHVYGGPYASIWSGMWQDKLVAIKVINPIYGKDLQGMKKKLTREMETWWSLKHPRIAGLYGSTDSFGNFGGMVSQWYKNGNAHEYLNQSKLSLRGRVNLWFEVIEAVAYLHERDPVVVHGDLKPANLLIDDEGHARLCDFGLARLIASFGSTGLTTTSEFSGTVRYLSYELCTSEDLPTMASDVHALGCVGLEMIFNIIPHGKHRNNRTGQITVDIREGKPPAERAVDLSEYEDALWNIIALCWTLNPDSRPSATQLLQLMSPLMAQ